MARYAIFVDGANIFHAYRIDYNKFSKFLLTNFGQSDDDIIGLKRFYTGAPVEDQVVENETPEETRERQDKIANQKKFWYAMEKYIGYTVIKRPLKTIDKGGKNERQKGNMDAQIAFELNDYRDEYDVLVFLAGDGDYDTSLKALAEKYGKRIIIVSTSDSIAKELIDLTRPSLSNIEFINLDDIRDKISMDNRRYA